MNDESIHNTIFLLCASASLRFNFPQKFIANVTVLFLLISLGCNILAAAPAAPMISTTSEDRSLTNAFSSALKLFEDEFYPEADLRFGTFITTYTNSSLVPSAILFQARSRLEQSNYTGAIELLRAKLPDSGNQTENYFYWMAEALFAQGNYPEAAETYSNLNVTFPRSALRAAAALGEARAFAKLGAWPKVVELLGKSDGSFQPALRLQPKDDAVTRGNILFSQALFAQNQFAEAERILRSIDAEGLAPELDWQRNYWLCRVQLANGHLLDALQTCTNSLTVLAAGRWRDSADTIALSGEIFEKLGRLQEATEAYTNNLAPGLPVDVQRHALFKAVGLMLKQNQTQEASRRLEAFIEKETHDSAIDVARLTLGELQLKAFYSASDSGTNAALLATHFLRQAMTNFSRVLLDYADSPLRGKACLDRGWCYWAQGKITEAKTDFSEAIPRLPGFEDQVVARFKLADAQFALREYSAAVTNYNLVIQESERLPALRNGILSKALYQLLRASVENNDSATADAAVARIVEGYHSNFTDECLLLYGEFQSRKNRGIQARQILADMIKRFPTSRVRPETDFVVARSYAQEDDWMTASDHYDRWVTNYPQHTLLPQAEFSRALAHDKAGQEAHALELFTSFVARFPTNMLAPWAQNWVADYNFNHGLFDTAEKNYLDLTVKFPTSELVYHARLMAGRSAFARQGPKDIKEARDYFTKLVNDMVKDSNAPPVLLPQTYFALGDTIFQQYRESTTTNSLEPFTEAVSAFSWITNNAPTNVLAPLAVGRIGDCYFEWASRSSDPDIYTNAAEFYQAVLQYPQAGMTARSSALVKLGLTSDKMGQTTNALRYYEKVIYEMDAENFDPVWVKEAGVNAAQLCEKQEQWDKAIRVYRRVLVAIPSLRPVLEKKIAAATARLEAVKR